jgi:hypothetical protein
MRLSIACPHSAPMRSSSDLSAGDRKILCVGMWTRKMWICAFSSLIWTLCQGMKSRDRKTRRRGSVEIILPGSTTTIDKSPLCQCDKTCLHFGIPLREDQNRAGRKMAVRKPRGSDGILAILPEPAMTAGQGADRPESGDTLSGIMTRERGRQMTAQLFT